MGIGTNELNLGSNVYSLVGNRRIDTGVEETCQIPIEQLSTILSPAAVRAVFSTKAEMDGSLGYQANAGAEVHADPVSSQNGIYRKLGGIGTGSWTKISNLGVQEISSRIAFVEEALNEESLSRTTSDATLQDELQQRATTEQLNTERSARVAGDASLRAVVASAAGFAGRLAEMGLFATAQTAGAPQDVLPLGSAAYALSPLDGAVVVMTGAATVAPIALTKIEPGRVYRIRYVLRRVVDTDNPNGDGVLLAVHWHSPAMVPKNLQTLEILNGVNVASGRLEHSYTLAVADDGQVDFVAPSGGLYARPYIHTYGSGVAHAVLAQIEDITGAIDWSPDVTIFRNQLAGLEALQTATASRLDSFTRRVIAAEARAAQAAYQEISTDADFTVSFGSSAKVLRHTGMLTAARRAIIATTDALEGQTARIVRTGGGSFPLNARNGSTTLKAMSAGTWAEFTFDGSAWFLSASGAL